MTATDCMGRENRGFGKDKNRGRGAYLSIAEQNWHHADQPIHRGGGKRRTEYHVGTEVRHALNAFIYGIDMSRNLDDREGARFNLVTT